MATSSVKNYSLQRKADGWLAQVNVRPFARTARTFPDKAEAREWAEKLADELRERRGRREDRTFTAKAAVREDVAKLTVGGLIVEFLEDPETTALLSFDDIHRQCSWWSQSYGSRRVMEFDVLTLREARDSIREERGPATTNRYLSSMRNAWNWGRASGLIPTDYHWPQRLMLTEPEGRVRFLNDEELAAVKVASRDFSVQMFAAVMVSIATGVRQSELLRLDWPDVDYARHTIRVSLSKNKAKRAVHLPESACDALRVLQREKVRSISGAVFTTADGERLKKSTLESRWKIVRDAAALVDFHWHDLRHTCASIMAQNGATLLEIGAQLGHKSPAMTQRYAHLVQGVAMPSHAALDTKLRS